MTKLAGHIIAFYANYDKNVEKAAKLITKAEVAFMKVLENTYPLNSYVMVVRGRGYYYGHVVGHSLYGQTVSVKNIDSGKITHRYYLHVQIS